MTDTLYTTLALLRQHGVCSDRYAHLRRKLGRSWPDDRPIPLLRILDENGLDEALWTLRAVEPRDEAQRFARLLACDFACSTPLGDGRVTYDLLTDERSRRAIEVAEAFAYGCATKRELDAAGAAAGAAAWDAAWAAAWAAAGAAAGAAAWVAAREAVRDAAWVAAWVAAREAVRAAAGAAAGAAAWDAAGAAAKKWQEACLRQWLAARDETPHA